MCVCVCVCVISTVYIIFWREYVHINNTFAWDKNERLFKIF